MTHALTNTTTELSAAAAAATAAMAPPTIIKKDSQTMCQCHQFLNPFPVDNGSQQGNPSSLSHYCRVCNIQLNSCRQAGIHQEGKKHQKRLHYLKICLETSKTEYAPPVVPDYAQQSNYSVVPPPPPSAFYGVNQTVSNCPTTYYLPTLLNAANASYTQQAPPPPPPQTTQVPPPNPYAAPAYQAYSPVAPPYQEYYHYQVPQPLVATAPPPPVQQTMVNPVAPPYHATMSPSLTSGFSGSGGDCKSTETSSILSANSYSSSSNNLLLGPKTWVNNNSVSPYSAASSDVVPKAMLHHHHHQYHTDHLKSNKPRNQLGSLKTLSASSDFHQVSFHQSEDSARQLSGSRKALNMSGLSKSLMRIDHHSSRRMKCEVCQVSVNSSQQLHAHLAGQKHKVRAIRRGLKVDQPIVSPSSSTVTSASESESGYPNGQQIEQGQQLQKFHRRGSDVNLLHHPQAAGNNKFRNRSFTMSGGGRGEMTLSRHLSSSCLAHNCMSRSTSSLRKAISSTALNNKSRSMNLIGCDRRNGVLHASELQTPWSNESENSECSSSYENDVDDVEEYEEEPSLEQHNARRRGSGGHKLLTQDNGSFYPPSPAGQTTNVCRNKNACRQGLNGQTDPNNLPLAYKAGAAAFHSTSVEKNKKSKLAPSKQKKRHSSFLLPSWRQNHNNNNLSMSAPANGGGQANNNSFKEIPMLNVFLQRLNHHSLRRGGSKNRVSNDSDGNSSGNMQS